MKVSNWFGKCVALTDEKQAGGGGGYVVNGGSAEFFKVSVLCRL